MNKFLRIVFFFNLCICFIDFQFFIILIDLLKFFCFIIVCFILKLICCLIFKLRIFVRFYSIFINALISKGKSHLSQRFNKVTQIQIAASWLNLSLFILILSVKIILKFLLILIGIFFKFHLRISKFSLGKYLSQRPILELALNR